MINPTDFYSQEDYEAALEEAAAPFASPSDARREWAANAGAMEPDRQWILTVWDTWERNPHYHGPEQRHPESDPDDEPRPDMPYPEIAQGGDDIPF